MPVFDWDPLKERVNMAKHGVAFDEAMSCFFDPDGFKFSDASHSQWEDRLLWVGKSRLGRILTTWYTMRSDDIRIIGCAGLRKYRKVYEEIQKGRIDN